MEVGLYTFGDVGRDPVTGATVDAQTRLGNLMEEIRLADELGLDIFGLGEHHRPNYAISSPATVLSAAAAENEGGEEDSGKESIGDGVLFCCS